MVTFVVLALRWLQIRKYGSRLDDITTPNHCLKFWEAFTLSSHNLKLLFYFYFFGSHILTAVRNGDKCGIGSVMAPNQKIWFQISVKG